ncbi:MAG: hypothetical protein IJ417_06895, partial [Bacteroidaceae bacterium]|nr:hypothetical protein [Bacteroidaceae bacterium]
ELKYSFCLTANKLMRHREFIYKKGCIRLKNEKINYFVGTKIIRTFGPYFKIKQKKIKTGRSSTNIPANQQTIRKQ